MGGVLIVVALVTIVALSTTEDEQVRNTAVVLSVIFAVLAFGLSLESFRKAEAVEERSVEPILVLSSAAIDGAARWTVRNLGSGPALQARVWHSDPTQAGRGRWILPVLLPDIAGGAAYTLLWDPKLDDVGIGLTYENLYGERRASLCRLGRNSFPEPTSFSKIGGLRETMVHAQGWDITRALEGYYFKELAGDPERTREHLWESRKTIKSLLTVLDRAAEMSQIDPFLRELGPLVSKLEPAYRTVFAQGLHVFSGRTGRRQKELDSLEKTFATLVESEPAASQLELTVALVGHGDISPLLALAARRGAAGERWRSALTARLAEWLADQRETLAPLVHHTGLAQLIQLWSELDPGACTAWIRQALSSSTPSLKRRFLEGMFLVGSGRESSELLVRLVTSRAIFDAVNSLAKHSDVNQLLARIGDLGLDPSSGPEPATIADLPRRVGSPVGANILSPPVE